MNQDEPKPVRISRREWVQAGGLLAAGGLSMNAAALAAPALHVGTDIYQSIGVRPMINCEGVITIIGGSLTLPEVKRAMDEASRQYVHLDELAEAVGSRLAELTGAEWGIVTSGCAGAMTHATSACITGGDPEKLQRLPDLTGLKNEVVVPRYCRNVYDHAVRMLGVRMVEVETVQDLEAALSPRTAMIYMFLGNANQPENRQASRELSLETVVRFTRPKNVPVLVDCAAERLSDDYLKRGASLLAYSGGKLLRGPQCAGLLLGRKDLVKAAWINAAPHHSFGRPMKAGKEEIMGMLAAVEMWKKRDHQAEWKQWQAWVDYMADRIGKAPGVTTETATPDTPVQRCPRLHVSWDSEKLGITGKEAEKLLFEGTPRIRVARAIGSRRDTLPSSFMLLPIMMSAGEEKLVAERVHALLSNPPRLSQESRPEGPPSQVEGQWSVEMEFLAGSSRHTLFLEQHGTELRGTHHGEFLSGDLHGTVEGREVRFRSSHHYEGSYLNYEFSGTAEGETMHGTVTDIATITPGEYGQARWSAQRHHYAEPPGPTWNQPRKSD
jgi:L-seryl-tRNA(Ser) seleniumtransferase